MHKTSVRDTKGLLTVEVTGKMTRTVKIFKKRNNFKKCMATPTFYIFVHYAIEVASLCNTWLVSHHGEKLFRLNQRKLKALL